MDGSILQIVVLLSWNLLQFKVRIPGLISHLTYDEFLLYLTRFRAASGGPRSPFGFEEAFKEGRCIQGGEMHSRREDAFKRN